MIVRLSNPISHETAYELMRTLKEGRRFQMVGRTLLLIDPYHRRVLVRDGYMAPVNDIKMWHGLDLELDGRALKIGSAFMTLVIPVSNE